MRLGSGSFLCRSSQGVGVLGLEVSRVSQSGERTNLVRRDGLGWAWSGLERSGQPGSVWLWHGPGMALSTS